MKRVTLIVAFTERNDYMPAMLWDSMELVVNCNGMRVVKETSSPVTVGVLGDWLLLISKAQRGEIDEELLNKPGVRELVGEMQEAIKEAKRKKGKARSRGKGTLPN
jgi:hypothetical protein